MPEPLSTTAFAAPTRAKPRAGPARKPEEFKSHVKPDWCPSCGDFGVLNSLQKACAELGIEPKDILVVSGIGCSSNLPGFFQSYGVHSLHGRAVAVASGAKLANPELTVIVTGGDGDGYGIGVGHFLHAARRNLDITYIVMNNQIYGLTTGQASATSGLKMETKSTPEGVIEQPLNPIALALSVGATFVSRAFSGEPAQMTDILKRAIEHKGFALVDCFSPCVTYNKINTYQWFKQNVVKLDSSHDPSSLRAAMLKALEEEKLSLGVLYQRRDLKSYEELDPTISRSGPAVKQPLGLSPEEREALLQPFY